MTPRELSGQGDYFRGKVLGKSVGAGQAGGGQRHCIAVFEQASGSSGEWQQLWARPLLNDVSPVTAEIDDGGKFVATFDNWHSTGYGHTAVVIYGSGGSVMGSFSLLDLLSPEEVGHLRMTVSSMQWYDPATTFERAPDQSVILVLHVRQQTPSGTQIAPIVVRIDAASGKLLRSPQDLRQIAKQKAECRSLPLPTTLGTWRACDERKLSEEWCALCDTLREEAAQPGVEPDGSSGRGLTR